MLEFVEIYWRSNVNNRQPPLSASEFVVIYLCRQFAQVAQDAIETDVIYSRLRPVDKEYVIFDQLPKKPQSKNYSNILHN